MGEEWYATTREPEGVATGALVAWGSAGRWRDARLSRGWDDEATRATPDGVGVKGGGLVGDSDAAALRFFGKGVAGSEGIAKSVSVDVGLVSCFVAVGEALVLRFFGAGAAFSTLVYWETPFVVLVSVAVGAVLLATRAERLRDMMRLFARSERVLVFICI